MTQIHTAEQALQLAIMTRAGMPSRDAVRYFADPSMSEKDLDYFHDAWMRSKAYAQAVVKLQGKPWQDLTLEQMLDLVAKKAYTEMAYFLYANNLAELSGPDLTKANTFRVAIEQKMAGQAGKLDALSQFWDDLAKGRISLTAPPATAKTLPIDWVAAT